MNVTYNPAAIEYPTTVRFQVRRDGSPVMVVLDWLGKSRVVARPAAVGFKMSLTHS